MTDAVQFDHEPRCCCGHLYEICNAPNCSYGDRTEDLDKEPSLPCGLRDRLDRAMGEWWLWDRIDPKDKEHVLDGLMRVFSVSSHDRQEGQP